jgi:hypothetical protein
MVEQVGPRLEDQFDPLSRRALRARPRAKCKPCGRGVGAADDAILRECCPRLYDTVAEKASASVSATTP